MSAWTREGRRRPAGEQDQRDAEPLERGQHRQHLVGLAGVGQGQHHVFPGDHAEVAVHAFGGMEEVGRGAGARERRGDLAPDEARLAHPGDDDAPATAVQGLHRGHEPVVEARAQREHALRLEAQHALRERQDPLAVHQARAGPAAIARSSSSSRGRSSRRSMLGPSERGRPSVERAVRVLVHLHEEGVHPDRHRRARESLHVLALAARAIALPARELHRVGRVEDDRIAEGPHDRQPAEVDH